MIRILMSRCYILSAMMCLMASPKEIKAQTQYVYPAGSCVYGCSDYYFIICTNYKISHAGWCAGTTASGGTDGYNSYYCPSNAFSGIPTQDTGNILVPIGPNYNVPHFYMAEHSTCNNSCTGSSDFGNVWTNPIYAPNNVNAATGTYSTAGSCIQFATVTWAKGSDMPDSTITYKIFRDGSQIGSMPGGVYSFNDSVLLQTGYYLYSVSTHTDTTTGRNGSPSWSTQESSQTSAGVYITNELLTASQGTQIGMTHLSWCNLAPFSPNGIEVSREGQQLAIINANATVYDDYSGTPGIVYQYTIAPINSSNQTPLQFSATGYTQPNGILSGYVKSTQGTGVPGVTVKARAMVDSDAYNYGTHIDSFTSVTDNTGFYSMSHIFYNTSAAYSITASRDSDKFNPSVTIRTLTIQSNDITVPDIIDTSAFTVSGHVYYKPMRGLTYNNPTDTLVPLSGAHVTVNGVNTGDTTDASGRYSFSAEVIGNYTITMSYENHQFDSATRVRYISDNRVSELDFYDITTDTLLIDLKSGCNLRIVDSAQFMVQSYPGGQIAANVHFDGSDISQIVLPATKYSVDIFNTARVQGVLSYTISTDPSPGLAKLNTITVDLTHRDTSIVATYDTVITQIDTARIQILQNGDTLRTAADTIRQIDTLSMVLHPVTEAKFVYQFPLTITVQQLPYLCNTNNTVFLVNQGVNYYPKISVYQQSVYIDTQICPLTTGTVQIYDYVSGAGLVTGQLTNGTYYYPLVPGQPNVPSDSGQYQYQKLMYISITALGESQDYNAWMLVQGNRELMATYNTTPQIPLMMLHQPPGNASYSYLSKDTVVTLNTTIDKNSQFAGGGQAQVALGAATGDLALPFENFTFQGTGGYNKDSNYVTAWTYTANQTISTTPGAPYVGMMGDVFIGAAMNMKYATAFQLNIDSSTCMPKVDTVLLYGIDSVSTQFIYSVYDLKNTIIPNLYNLRDLADSSSDSTYNKAYFQNQINVWLQALAHDSVAQVSSHYRSNISYTAGTSDNYSFTSDEAQTTSYTYAITGSIATQILAGVTNANAFTIGVGAVFNWNTSSGSTGSRGLETSTTFGYQLSDNVPGNYYSVNIGADKFYGSPVFNIFGGASACPWEPGTQQRDVPTLTIDPPIVQDVPATSLASMIAFLGNQSESQEPRTYQVSLDPSSNPNGAIVTIGGQDITQNVASFTIASGGSLPTALTVQKGPFAADYNLNISISSSCDPNISATVPISVSFQNSCSEVSLLEPADGWLINSSSGDTLGVVIGGYDASNTSLEEIGIQYRTIGTTGLGTSQWAPMQSTIQDSLALRQSPVYISIPFNTALLPDGNYQIQAYAHCGSGVNSVYTYSTPLTGVIDRSSFTLYGTPTPSDGVLNLGGTIGITFNNDIDCSGVYGVDQTSLIRNDNGTLLPSAFSCYGNGLILTTYPDSLINTLDGVELTASVNNVHDINGNGINSPITWSFLVSTSKIFWSPGSISTTTTLGSGPTITGTLVNVGQADSFSFIKIPSWLTLVPLASYHLPAGTPQIPSPTGVSFVISGSLNEGQYADTVIIIAAGRREYLYVNVDVVTQAPNWTVNPSNFLYNMNITTNYSTTSLNAPLSSDIRDKVAVFVGNECRGVANITYNPVSNNYAAFITAYSNNSTGDTFTFRMWDALPGIEYQAVERKIFLADGTIGQPSSPFILHPAGEFQTIDLATGWNWFSLNVAATDMSPANVLASITGNNGAVVKGQNAYDQFTTRSTGWTGALGSFSTNSSYMINLDHADTLHFLGQPVTDTSIVSVALGWNWIGFPRQKITTDSLFLHNLNPTDSDVFKSQTQFAEYTSGSWAGSMTYMYPGEGYRLKSNNAINFVVPPDRSLPGWSADQHLFEQNMTVTADLQFDGMSTLQSHYLVGAFANNICVGTAQPEFIPSLNLYRVFLTISGDVANAYQPLSFKVYDTDNDIEYVPTYLPISIVPDTVVSRVEAPYVINIQTSTGINALSYTDGFSLLQNIPNPFAKATSIEYVIPSAQQATLTVYDESGRMIRELVNGIQSAGNHTVSFDQGDLQAGVYFYQMKSGDFVKTRRMVIL